MPTYFESYRGLFEREYRTAYLITSFIKGDISDEEEEELEEWILQSEDNMKLFEDLTDERVLRDTLQWYHSLDVKEAWQKMEAKIKTDRRRKTVRFVLYGAAASIIVVLGLAILFFQRPNKPNPVSITKASHEEIQPVSSRPTLRLADGSQVALTESLDSLVNTKLRIEQGQIKYNDSQSDAVFQELSVPRKGFYQLVLPDASRVWLNSESWIRFPNAFTAEKSEVQVKGEVYIEVAKDARHPFVASVGQMHVTALGTAFNINAYHEEGPVSTTLVEGKIQVLEGERASILRPGQQLAAATNQWQIREVDASMYTAWTRK